MSRCRLVPVSDMGRPEDHGEQSRNAHEAFRGSTKRGNPNATLHTCALIPFTRGSCCFARRLFIVTNASRRAIGSSV